MRICERVIAVHHEGAWTIVDTNVVQIRILFINEHTVRIRAGFDGDFAENSYSLVTTAWADQMDELLAGERTRVEPLIPKVTTTDATVTLATGSLSVEIIREPFRLIVRDVDGSVLHADLEDRAYFEDTNGRRVHTSQIADDDRFYGFGEKSGHLNKAKKHMRMNPQDSMGYDALETDSLYKHIPFYIKMSASTRKAVGYFYHNTFECEFDLGRSKSNYWPAHSIYRTDGGDIDLFIIEGPAIRDVIERYTDLTGKSAMLPAKALGYLGSSMYYPELPKGADSAIVEFIDQAGRYSMPIDGFQLSSGYCQTETPEGLKRCPFTWNEDRFPDPQAFFADMDERGIVVSPNVKPGILTVHPLIDEMKNADIFIKTAISEEPVVGRWWGGSGHFVDLTNPKAREYWKNKLRESLLDVGARSIWNDNCEYDSIVDKDARCSFEGKGSTIRELKPVMSNLMCMITQDTIREYGCRPFVVCRSGYAGIQRYAQTWSGDNSTSWETLRFNVPTMLGMSLSGVANQGSDVGGFHGPAPDPELFLRWVQNGIFQPRFSIHSANNDNTVTEPWMHAQMTDAVRVALQLRYRLFPYFYSLMRRAAITGLPIIEPLVSAFQDDPDTDLIDDIFMVGDSLYVANVLEPGASERAIYVPAGQTLIDIKTGVHYVGRSRISVPVDLASIPMFIKAGGIITMSDVDVDRAGSDQVSVLRVICAPQAPGSFTLYEDDGISESYLDGDYRETRIDMIPGEVVRLDFTVTGRRETTIERLNLDVMTDGRCPYWIRVAGEEIPHLLDRKIFAGADKGWYFDPTRKSVYVTYPNSAKNYSVEVSFEEFDIIGM